MNQTNMEDIAYDKLKNAIIKRYIKQGSKLVESSLAEQIGVSRTPVRSAIKRLVYEGFASFIPNRGAFVIKPTEEEIRKAFAVRAQLEKMGAGLAAARISKPNVDELNRLIIQEQTTFESRDLDQYYVINDALHLLVAETSGNEILVHYIHELMSKTKVYLILYDPFFQMQVNPSIDEHQNLVWALKQQDPLLAESMMEKHLQSALEGMDFHNVFPQDYISV